MSRVTVVPALRAAWQIVRALSSATLCPSSGSACPTAESLTDTSAFLASPWSPSALSRSRYAVTVASACSRSRVSSPRKSRVTCRPSSMSSSVARTASPVDSPGTYRATMPLETGIEVTKFLTLSLRASISNGCRNTNLLLHRRAAAPSPPSPGYAVGPRSPDLPRRLPHAPRRRKPARKPRQPGPWDPETQGPRDPETQKVHQPLRHCRPVTNPAVFAACRSACDGSAARHPRGIPGTSRCRRTALRTWRRRCAQAALAARGHTDVQLVHRTAAGAHPWPELHVRGAARALTDRSLSIQALGFLDALADSPGALHFGLRVRFHLRIPAPHPECLGKSPSQRRNAALGADDSFPATGTCPSLLLRERAAGRVAEPSHLPRHAAKTPG